MTPRRDAQPMVTLDQVSGRVELIDQRLESDAELDKERRKIDDDRYRTLSNGQGEVLKLVNDHGARTTALETKWTAFFGDQGAFKGVIKGLEDQGKKIDKLTWIVASGIGGLAVVQFIAEFFIRK